MTLNQKPDSAAKKKERRDAFLGLAFLVGFIALSYEACWAPRKIENVIVTDFGSYQGTDGMDIAYSIDFFKIDRDNHCYQYGYSDPKPNVGQKLSALYWHPVPLGPCRAVIDYTVNLN